MRLRVILGEYWAPLMGICSGVFVAGGLYVRQSRVEADVAGIQAIKLDVLASKVNDQAETNKEILFKLDKFDDHLSAIDAGIGGINSRLDQADRDRPFLDPKLFGDGQLMQPRGLK
jgi:hypothetical protein